MGEPHPNDPSTVVADREARPFRPGESLHVWLVTIVYSSGAVNTTGDRWRWGVGFISRVARKGFFFSSATAAWTVQKIPFLTSALGRYEHPPEIDEPFLVLQVTRGLVPLAYYTLLPTLRDALLGTDGQGTVNMEQFHYHGMTFEQDEVRFVEFQSEMTTADEGGAPFVAVTFTFHIRKGGWYDDLLDEDVATINPSNFKRVPIGDFQGNPITEPMPLNGNGQALSFTPGTPAHLLQGFYMRYRKFDRFPYASIGFP